MIHFECDYAEGAHPRILERLIQTNNEQTPGYGEDEHCVRAADYIRDCCGARFADVHFLSGGTQVNLTAIGAILRPHQGVISAESGHILGHETGAIEATGHKALSLTSADGKITGAQVDALCREHFDDDGREHSVQPGMVYISHPTERGTLYTKQELEELSRICRKWSLPLYMDGARLSYGLAAAEAADAGLALRDIAALCDLFYIGGTKTGAMFGEALVIIDEAIKKDFRYHIKQRGALLAKGRMLGIQFEVLFEDGLYLEIARHAVSMADLIREAFAQKGFRFLYDSPANQLFPVLPEDAIKKLSENYVFFVWADAGEKDGHKEAAIRLCTSWATKEENVRQLLYDIAQL